MYKSNVTCFYISETNYVIVKLQLIEVVLTGEKLMFVYMTLKHFIMIVKFEEKTVFF